MEKNYLELYYAIVSEYHLMRMYSKLTQWVIKVGFSGIHVKGLMNYLTHQFYSSFLQNKTA